MATLILLRGNSASGKTTTAKFLQQALPQGTSLLVSQDVIRRDMLGVKDVPNNLAIELIRHICEFGKEHTEIVILEGILSAAIYKPMLFDLIDAFEIVLVYYFDLSFEETVIRHKKRPQAQEFGEDSLRKWWLDKDYLEVMNEKTLTQELSQEEIVAKILEELLKI